MIYLKLLKAKLIASEYSTKKNDLLNLIEIIKLIEIELLTLH